MASFLSPELGRPALTPFLCLFLSFPSTRAGFLVSARAGSGIVIAKLPDGSEYQPAHDFVSLRGETSFDDRKLTRRDPPFLSFPFPDWSAPSAIGTAGVGFGGQAGAEVTDFLIVSLSSSLSRRKEEVKEKREGSSTHSHLLPSFSPSLPGFELEEWSRELHVGW